MDMMKSMLIAASGMRAQSERWRIIAENLANASSTANKPGEDPYRRKVPVFQSELDNATRTETIRVKRIAKDMSAFREQYMPGHPAADARGYVKMPNVNSLIEMMDMRQAQRSYEANLGVIEVAKNMISRTIDILRG